MSNPSDQTMTPQEVYDYIEAQTDWNDGDKMGVWAVYTTYISMIPSQKHPERHPETDTMTIKRQESWRAELLGYGIKV